MDYCKLGNTGIEVSKIAFGGVSIGIPYGIGIESEDDMLTDQQAIELLRCALSNGINFFDTARAYGKSEKLMGLAFGDRREDVVICTKPDHFITKEGMACDVDRSIKDSVQKSLRELQCDYIDILMSHDGSLDVVNNPDVIAVFDELKNSGVIRAKGISVYKPEETRSAIESGVWDVIQLPYNLMDQSHGDLFELAKDKGVAIVVRSALFKGILTDRGRNLHPELKAVSDYRERYCGLLEDGETLSDFATRFVMSQQGVTSVLVGIDKTEYLNKALDVSRQGVIDETRVEKALSLAYPEPEFLDLPKWDRMGWLN
ncbi:MAG: aldo/keto reductase [Sedimentisphaeraceae bacterium JB056]